MNTGTSNGYFAGGYSSVNVIDNLTCSDDTVATLSAVLSTGRYALTGLSSSNFGYFSGGTTGTQSNVIDGLNFSSVSISTSAATLSSARSYSGGAQNTFTGYIAGGTTGSNVSTIDALIFVTLTCSALAATLSAKLSGARYYLGGSQSSTTGYFFGGILTSGTYVNSIDALTFSNNTCGAIGATLSKSMGLLTNVQSATTAYLQGNNSSLTFYSIVFSSTTFSTLSASLSTSRYGGAGVNSATNGFFCAGYPDTSAIDKLTFSSNTCAAISATLPAPVYSTVGVSNV